MTSAAQTRYGSSAFTSAHQQDMDANIGMIAPDDSLDAGVDSSQQSITTFGIQDVGKN